MVTVCGKNPTRWVYEFAFFFWAVDLSQTWLPFSRTGFALTAMYFFVYSNKEVHKKMPPLKLMPQALKDSLRSRYPVLLAIDGVKRTRGIKTPLRHLLPWSVNASGARNQYMGVKSKPGSTL